MIQKEKITIDELRGRFPNDPEIAAIQVQFQQRFAFELLDSKLRHRRRLNPEFREVQSEADLDAIAFWCQECRPLARLDQQSAADLAMMFYFMEEYPVALVILREAGDVRNANDPSRIWFEAEILLQSKLYLELLALLEWIETHLFEDGETTFAVMYLRAKALRGLGQKHHAIEMLEALVSARPDYRSAQWILNDWRDS